MWLRSGSCCQGARRPRWGRRCRSCPARESRSTRSSSTWLAASSSPNLTVAGQAQNANNRAVGAAAIGTILGAGLGAAIGGGRGAAIGAGSGALAGTGVGMGGSSNEQYGIQQQYDNAFAQCMYAKGNMVPGYGPMMVNAPPPPPPPPGYNGGLTAAVQQQLIRLGYLHGVADGVSGQQTSAAISQFESVSGLPADGVPSPQLLARLQATP